MNLRNKYFRAIKNWSAEEPGDRLLLLAFTVFVVSVLGSIVFLFEMSDGTIFEQAYYVGSLLFFFYAIKLARNTFVLERQKSQMARSHNIVRNITTQLSSSILTSRIKTDLAAALMKTIEHDKGNRRYALYSNLRHLSWEYILYLRETVFCGSSGSGLETQTHIETFLSNIKKQYDFAINHIYTEVIGSGVNEESILPKLEEFRAMPNLTFYGYSDGDDIVPESELVHFEQKNMKQEGKSVEFETYIGKVLTETAKKTDSESSWSYFDKCVNNVVSKINQEIARAK